MGPFAPRFGRIQIPIATLCAALVAAPDLPAADPPALAPVPAIYRAGFETINEREIRARIAFLASRELGGRGTGQPGYEVAAQYIASVLEGLGVKPGAADGTWFQSFELHGRDGIETARMVIEKEGAAAQEIPLGEKVGIRGLGDVADWELPWVFVGHGEAADADAPDDFEALGLDAESLARHVVLVLPPEGKTSDEHRGAVLRGAKKIVVISDRHAGRKRGFRSRPQPDYRLIEREGVPADVSVVYIAEETADRLLSLLDRPPESSGGGDGSETRPLSIETLRDAKRPRPFSLDGLKIHLEVRASVRRLTSRNVVGVLEGSDPDLKHELVGVGAHLDHMGTRDNRIFYGADDDASGVSAVLATAEAIAANPVRPRRSIVFMFFGAEELGLHGSRYLSDHPPFPISNMICELQIDMVGRNEETKDEKAADNVNSVHVVGSKKHSLELDGWVHRVNAPTGLDFEYDMEDVVYRRSDHYSFARLGVPVAFFFSGFHPDYHKVTDTPDKLNYTKILQVSRLVYSLAFEVANRPERLVNNRF